MWLENTSRLTKVVFRLLRQQVSEQRGRIDDVNVSSSKGNLYDTAFAAAPGLVRRLYTSAHTNSKLGIACVETGFGVFSPKGVHVDTDVSTRGTEVIQQNPARFASARKARSSTADSRRRSVSTVKYARYSQIQR